MRRKVAVIGAGISGMGAAHKLAHTHNVTLFEAGQRLGGHARTIIAGKNGDQPVDTGFIVFNYANYPHLAALFDELDVPVVKSNMSFGASIDGGRLEYALHGADAFFAQRKNALNPSFVRMLRDIFKFNKNALRVAEDPSLTIAEFLEVLGTGRYFRDYYLSPLSGAIWSTPTEKIMDFPAHAMVQFFENHALLNYSGQHQWYTVQDGSQSYVSRLEAAMLGNGVDIRLNAAVQGVRRNPMGVDVKTWGGEWEAFDEVVFATHSDDSLSHAFRRRSEVEQQTRCRLSIKYQPNDIGIACRHGHMMPKRRKVWSSPGFIARMRTTLTSNKIDLTYWMNSLQPIPHG